MKISFLSFLCHNRTTPPHTSNTSRVCEQFLHCFSLTTSLLYTHHSSRFSVLVKYFYKQFSSRFCVRNFEVYKHNSSRVSAPVNYTDILPISLSQPRNSKNTTVPIFCHNQATLQTPLFTFFCHNQATLQTPLFLFFCHNQTAMDRSFSPISCRNQRHLQTSIPVTFTSYGFTYLHTLPARRLISSTIHYRECVTFIYTHAPFIYLIIVCVILNCSNTSVYNYFQLRQSIESASKIDPTPPPPQFFFCFVQSTSVAR